MSPQSKPSIVFAHGLWADGSCYSKLTPTLQAEGHEVVSAQNSLDSLEGDVAAVRRALGRVSSPAVLVGHSQGGTIITHAGTDDRVAALVYICALLQRNGGKPAGQFPQTGASNTSRSQRAHLVAPGRDRVLRGRSSPEEQQLVCPQGVPAADLFEQKAPGAAWKSKPSCYVLGNNDHTVNPELQRFVSQRMGATVFAVDSSHVPMLSHPNVVLDAIRQAARAVQESAAAVV
jgi:pimeloyl-ACP methyl ester carboxylesterase